MPDLRFFVFTCREPAVDFRLGLVAALRRDFEVWTIWLKRLPVVAGPRNEDRPRPISFLRLLGFLRAEGMGAKVPVYLNSSNTIYPGLTTLLKLTSPPGIWCLDMHDDLLYPHEGVRLLRRRLAISLMRWSSALTVVAAPNLRELYPDARHLGNAGASGVIRRVGVAPHKVLILASIDLRFDFDLLERISKVCLQLEFHIHGHAAASVHARLAALLAMCPNVRYHGAYVAADLTGILANYLVSFAPYVQEVRQTRYIDPLRFYHCLNSGMEVITTDIPAARMHEQALHIVHNEREFAALFDSAGTLKQLRQPHHKEVGWQQRADQFVNLIRSMPHARRIRRAAFEH